MSLIDRVDEAMDIESEEECRKGLLFFLMKYRSDTVDPCRIAGTPVFDGVLPGMYDPIKVPHYILRSAVMKNKLHIVKFMVENGFGDDFHAWQLSARPGLERIREYLQECGIEESAKKAAEKYEQRELDIMRRIRVERFGENPTPAHVMRALHREVMKELKMTIAKGIQAAYNPDGKGLVF